MACRLSILICTIPERRQQFNLLYRALSIQLIPGVEILSDDRPRGSVSVGAKRQSLLNKAQGDYIVFFDDDDWPSNNYINDIISALVTLPDCVGFKIRMTTNGIRPETCIHSLQNKVWEKKNGIYLRNVTHFNPVRMDLALQVGFKDMRFGEDKDYADRLSPLCKTEVFIDKFMFDYRYSNKESHKTKYGIQ